MNKGDDYFANIVDWIFVENAAQDLINDERIYNLVSKAVNTGIQLCQIHTAYKNSNQPYNENYIA